MKIRLGILASSICHMRRMCNLAEPSFASVIVPHNKTMWAFWKEEGISIEHPYLEEDTDEEVEF